MPTGGAPRWSGAAPDLVPTAQAGPLLAAAQAAENTDAGEVLALLRAAAAESVPGAARLAHEGPPNPTLGDAGAWIRGARVGSVGATAWTLDGSRVATGSSDGTIRLWDGRTFALLHTMMGHIEDIESLAFSPDGARLASASRDSFVRVWNAENGNLERELRGHSDSVEIVAWSPDGALLASGAWDGRVRLWEGTSDRIVATLEGHSEGIFSIAFSPDGARILTGSADTTARLWDTASASSLHQLVGHGGFVYATAFSPDGSLVATAGRDGATRIWDASTGEPKHELHGNGEHIFAVAFSADGKRITSAYWDGSGVVRDVASGSEVVRGRAPAGAPVRYIEGRIAARGGSTGADAAGTAGALLRLLERTGGSTSMRVCRGTTRVVDVPTADPASVWAPDDRCR